MNKINDILVSLLIVAIFILIIQKIVQISSNDNISRIDIKSLKINQSETKRTRNSTDTVEKVVIRKRPLTRIIRQPYPVGVLSTSSLWMRPWTPSVDEPPSNPTFLTNYQIQHRYGNQLPFSNPPPPNGPAFAGGYGPPEVPAANDFRL